METGCNLMVTGLRLRLVAIALQRLDRVAPLSSVGFDIAEVDIVDLAVVAVGNPAVVERHLEEEAAAKFDLQLTLAVDPDLQLGHRRADTVADLVRVVDLVDIGPAAAADIVGAHFVVCLIVLVDTVADLADLVVHIAAVLAVGDTVVVAVQLVVGIAVAAVAFLADPAEPEQSELPAVASASAAVLLDPVPFAVELALLAEAPSAGIGPAVAVAFAGFVVQAVPAGLVVGTAAESVEDTAAVVAAGVYQGDFVAEQVDQAEDIVAAEEGNLVEDIVAGLLGLVVDIVEELLDLVADTEAVLLDLVAGTVLVVAVVSEPPESLLSERPVALLHLDSAAFVVVALQVDRLELLVSVVVMLALSLGLFLAVMPFVVVGWAVEVNPISVVDQAEAVHLLVVEGIVVEEVAVGLYLEEIVEVLFLAVVAQVAVVAAVALELVHSS